MSRSTYIPRFHLIKTGLILLLAGNLYPSVSFGNPAMMETKEDPGPTGAYSFPDSCLLMDKNTRPGYYLSNTRRFHYFLRKYSWYPSENKKS